MTEEPAPRGRVDRAKAWYAGQPKGKRYGIGCCGCLGVGFVLLLILGLMLTALGITPDEDDADDATGAEESQENEELPEDEDEDADEEGEEADTEGDATTSLPDVTGAPADEARDELEEMDLEVEFDAGDSSVWDASNWEVESTEPEAGTDVEEGDEVTLHVVRPEDHDDDGDGGASGADAEGQDDAQDEELPADIDAQVDALGDLETFSEGEVFFRSQEDGEEYATIFVSQEIERAEFISSTMCTYAREDTIEALEFARDSITEDYDRMQLEFISRGEPDATGSEPIIGLATVIYDRETVESVDSDHVSPANVWEARDEGGLAPTCQ